MNKYELLQEENQDFWESLNNDQTKINRLDFSKIDDCEINLAQELEVEVA